MEVLRVVLRVRHFCVSTQRQPAPQRRRCALDSGVVFIAPAAEGQGRGHLGGLHGDAVGAGDDDGSGHAAEEAVVHHSAQRLQLLRRLRRQGAAAGVSILLTGVYICRPGV